MLFLVAFAKMLVFSIVIYNIYIYDIFLPQTYISVFISNRKYEVSR